MEASTCNLTRARSSAARNASISGSVIRRSATWNKRSRQALVLKKSQRLRDVSADPGGLFPAHHQVLAAFGEMSSTVGWSAALRDEAAGSHDMLAGAISL